MSSEKADSNRIDVTESVRPPVDQQGLPWIDVSVSLRSAMVHWPGDPSVLIERVHDLERGDSSNLSRITMGVHTGTHVDAPRHFLRNGADISTMPLDTTVGIARVIEIQDRDSIKPEELMEHSISRGERILFKTRNSLHAWQSSAFLEDFVFISNEAADFLVERGVKAVGIDYLSVGSFKGNGKYVHQTLLGGGVWLIEGLDLSHVTPGEYYLVCLPIKIDQGDGAPARAVLKPVRAV